MSEIQNKGTGAGGSKTNVNGIAFEKKTDNEIRLLSNGFVRKNLTGKEKTKYGYYLEKMEENRTIHFVTQNGLKYYMSIFHQKELFREVDEAYIFIDKITNIITVKILEKKNQNGGGSVEDKLCLGHHFKFVEYPGCLGQRIGEAREVLLTTNLVGDLRSASEACNNSAEASSACRGLGSADKFGEIFQVEYAFCISAFLQNLYNSDHVKWKIIRKENEKNNIPVFFGDDDDYFTKLDEWIYS